MRSLVGGDGDERGHGESERRGQPQPVESHSLSQNSRPEFHQKDAAFERAGGARQRRRRVATDGTGHPVFVGGGGVGGVAVGVRGILRVGGRGGRGVRPGDRRLEREDRGGRARRAHKAAQRLEAKLEIVERTPPHSRVRETERL